jgi:hypothetical protein
MSDSMFPEMVPPPKPIIVEPEEKEPQINPSAMIKKYNKEAEQISDEIIIDLDSTEVSSDEDDLMPEPAKKQPLKTEEVFKTPHNNDIPEGIPVVAPVKKKKRVLTDKQKEALRLGREKAKITKARKKQERLDAQKQDQEFKELKVKKKKKDLESLRKDVDPTHSQERAPPEMTWGSKEDFDKAVNKAVIEGINGYDNLRKSRKVQKQKAEAKAKSEAKVFQDISRATRKPNPDDVWNVCFQ